MDVRLPQTRSGLGRFRPPSPWYPAPASCRPVPGGDWRLAAIPETVYADLEAYEAGVLIVDRHADGMATVYLYGHAD